MTGTTEYYRFVAVRDATESGIVMFVKVADEVDLNAKQKAFIESFDCGWRLLRPERLPKQYYDFISAWQQRQESFFRGE